MSGCSQLPSGLVTFMFTDIEGSTRLARLLGARYAGVLGAHRAILRRVLAEHGGRELFTEGDSFFVAFADATAALQAGVDAQRALAGHDWPSAETIPRVRIGLHTGRAEPINGEYASAEVHRAARIAAAAHGGQVLCSAATTRHAGLPDGAGLLDLGVHRLRGFDDSERLLQVVAPGLQRCFPRPRTPLAAGHNLPVPLTPFVGRRAECAAVTELLRGHRLVTVVGAGGAGKTRLALAAAEELTAAYPRGVWCVDLAGVSDPGDVPSAVAAACGLRPEPGRAVVDTLVEHASAGRMLLILDTCDAHPAAAAALALALLAGSADVTLLATGREPLAAHGELVWRIPPMSVRPTATGAVPDAVLLLTERVTAARGGRPVASHEVPDLHRVASALEGLPLALELAAARLRVLSAAELAARLDDPLAALDVDHPSNNGRPSASVLAAAGRHRSLRANLDWSCRTLSPQVTRLLRGLAVFCSPVDLATVEWVGGRDALGPLSILADKSLVDVVAGPSGVRYRMSGPTRAYAVSTLADVGEERAARDRHVGWALQSMRGIRVDAEGHPRTLSMHELAPFVDEWRAALRWSAVHGQARHGLHLADGLDPWWREHGDAEQACRWMTRLWQRSAATGERVSDAVIARGLLVHAGYAEPGERAELLRRAQVAARRADDASLLVRALAAQRVPLLEAGRVAEAERACRGVIRRADRLGVPEAALPAVVDLAELLWRRGALDEAAELLGAARQAEAANSRDRGRRTVDMLLGVVALRRGDLVAAHDHLVVALRSRMRCGFRADAAETVNAMAVRCALGGDPATAAILFGAGGSRHSVGRMVSGFAGYWAERQAALRASVGDTVFDPGYAAGARLDLDQAVAVALSVRHPDLEVGSARFGADVRASG